MELSRLQTVVGLLAGLSSIGGAMYSGVTYLTAPGQGEVAGARARGRTERPIRDATVEYLTPEDGLLTTLAPAADGWTRYPLREGGYRVRVTHSTPRRGRSRCGPGRRPRCASISRRPDQPTRSGAAGAWGGERLPLAARSVGPGLRATRPSRAPPGAWRTRSPAPLSWRRGRPRWASRPLGTWRRCRGSGCGGTTYDGSRPPLSPRPRRGATPRARRGGRGCHDRRSAGRSRPPGP